MTTCRAFGAVRRRTLRVDNFKRLVVGRAIDPVRFGTLRIGRLREFLIFLFNSKRNTLDFTLNAKSAVETGGSRELRGVSRFGFSASRGRTGLAANFKCPPHRADGDACAGVARVVPTEESA